MAAQPTRRQRAGSELTLSTATVKGEEQFGYWRDAVCETFLPVRPRRSGSGSFAGEIRGRVLGPLVVAQIASQAQRVQRTPELVLKGGGDAVFLNIQLRGAGGASQDGRSVRQLPGDMAVVDGTRPFELSFESDFTQLCLAMPVEAFTARLALPRAATAVRIGGDAGLGSLLVAQLAHLVAHGEGLDREGAALLADQLLDLLALCLGRAASLPRSSGRALLLQAALDDVERNLADPGLCPGDVAARVNVSTRYLHRLFAEQGTSFGRWVLARRLERCRRDLAEPGLAHLTVGQLAERWGFRDRSHFARAFRAGYGMAPTQWRARGASAR